LMRIVYQRDKPLQAGHEFIGELNRVRGVHR
jgi:hypothetical protein